jgi:hypothetical protein
MDTIDVQSMAGLVALAVAVAQLIGKVIPDTATGPLGVVRKLAKIIGLYAPNAK